MKLKDFDLQSEEVYQEGLLSRLKAQGAGVIHAAKTNLINKEKEDYARSMSSSKGLEKGDPKKVKQHKAMLTLLDEFIQDAHKIDPEFENEYIGLSSAIDKQRKYIQGMFNTSGGSDVNTQRAKFQWRTAKGKEINKGIDFYGE